MQGGFVRKQLSLLVMWLIADFHHQCGAHAALTQQPAIRILVFGWRRAKIALHAYRMTLARSVQISKCCDWYACNHQWAESQLYYLLDRVFAAMKSQLSGLSCPTERDTYCSVIMQNINFWGLFILHVFLFLWKWNSKFTAQPYLIYLPSESERSRVETWNMQKQLTEDFFFFFAQKLFLKMESNAEAWKRRDLQQSVNPSLTQQYTTTAFLFHTQRKAAAQGLLWLHHPQRWIPTPLTDMCCVTSLQNIRGGEWTETVVARMFLCDGANVTNCSPSG